MPDYIAMEFVLLLAVVTASSGLIIVSDGTQTPFLLDCRIPNDSSLESINVNLTQEDIEELKIEGQCFLECATLRYKIHETNPEIISRDYSYWPYINISALNCTISAKIHECTRGCIRNYYDDVPACTELCLDSCTESQRCDPLTSDCHPWIRRQCPITCDGNSKQYDDECLLGCRLYNDFHDAFNEEHRPVDPIGPPRLIPDRSTERAGQFMVNLSDAAPQPPESYSSGSGDPIEPAPVVFLFKYKELYSHNVSYDWVASPLASPMDLGDYACQELSVSFAVSSVAGLSQFSPPYTNIIVHGDERDIPNPPTNIWISEEIDTRIGFFGHVILNISWDGPQNDAYLDNFTVTVTPAMEIDAANKSMCDSETWSKNVSYDQSNIIVKAETMDSLPVLSCHYSIQIYGAGPDGRSEPLESTHAAETIFNHSSIVFECQRLWQPPQFLFNLTWTLPPYLSHGNVINGFVVKQRTTSDSEPVIEIIPFPLDGTMTFSVVLQNATSYDMPQVMNSESFVLEMFVMWNSGSIPYVPPRHNYTCVESTHPPAPSLIEEVMATSCSVNDSIIKLDVEWSPPAVINGELDFYDIWIDDVSLLPHENSMNPHYSSVNTSFHITIELISENPLYVQIRAHNLYIQGNWSVPYLISNTLCQKATQPMTNESTIKIVGSSIASLMLTLVVVSLASLAFYLCTKMLLTRKSLRRTVQGPYDPMFSGQISITQRPLAAARAAVLQPDEWEIPANEVIMEKPLGEGAFGEVFKGIVKCPIVNPKVPSSVKSSICTHVAIKLLKKSAKGNERQDFLSEIEMMKKIAEGQNTHVVGLLGCVTIQEPLCLITEFIKYGDLLSYLRTNRRLLTGNSCKEARIYSTLGNITSNDLISFAYQIATGMEYLSSLGIVHRDLACRNILVDEGKVLKISDLGMSRETDEIYVQKRTGRVPLKWMAIESIIAREFTTASDVWSYGIVLWEIDTLGGFPYPSIQNEELLPMLMAGYRMEKPDNCSPEIYDIMLTCWNEKPENRPPFSKLRSKFDAMLLADKQNHYIELQIDHSKLCYQNLTPMLTVSEEGACDSTRSINAAEHIGKYLSRSTNPSPSHESHCSSSSMVHSKQQLISQEASRDIERNNQASDSTRRPLSLRMSYHDQNKLNPYADPPLRMVSISSFPSTTHWGSSNEAIEMKQLRSENVEYDTP